MLEAILLGILQGITEFLPISSSGHLVLAQSLLPGFTEPGLLFDTLLHAGTLAAVLLYFRKDVTGLILASLGHAHAGSEWTPAPARRMLLALFLATIPAGIVGILWEDRIEKVFEEPLYTSMFLCLTALILFLGEFGYRRFPDPISPEGSSQWKSWIWVGLAQSLALLPGVSRSGSTIAAGLWRGWNRSGAARFSFLLMIPAVGGAVLLKIPDLVRGLQQQSVHLEAILAGMACAAVSGYMALFLLMRMIRKNRLTVFAVYCFLIGLVSLAWTI